MGIIDRFSTKAAELLFARVDKNRLFEAMYQYKLSEGIAHVMPDNFDSYIRDAYQGNADVYSIINRIDSMRKQAELVLMRKAPDGAIERVTDHPLTKFLNRVNPYTTTNFFISEFLTYRLTLGNVFAYKLRLDYGPNKGKTAEVHMMPASDVEIIEGSWMQPVKGYKIEGSYNKLLTLDEVYHNKMVNPDYGGLRNLYGQSPLKAAARVVSKQNQAELTELKQFENQGPPYIMYKDSQANMPGGGWTPEQRDTVVKEMQKAGKGTKQGLPAVLGQKVGIIDLGRVLADLNVIESSRDGRRILCNIYGFPVDLMNDPAGSTYNNKSTARKSAWTDCIMPNLFEVSDAFDACFIYGTEWEGEYYFDFDYSQVEELQEGMDIKVGWMRDARWTPNEIREATGKPQYEDPLMDVPFFDVRDVPIDKVSAEDTKGAIIDSLLSNKKNDIPL